MFISSAFAQEAADVAAGAAQQAGGSDLWVMFLQFGLIMVVFYLLLIRPQQKKLKAHQMMVSALKKGDEIVTSGGLVGTVAKVKENGYVAVDIAEGVRVTVVQSMISQVLSGQQTLQAPPSKDS